MRNTWHHVSSYENNVALVSIGHYIMNNIIKTALSWSHIVTNIDPSYILKFVVNAKVLLNIRLHTYFCNFGLSSKFPIVFVVYFQTLAIMLLVDMKWKYAAKQNNQVVSKTRVYVLLAKYTWQNKIRAMKVRHRYNKILF